MRLPTEAEMRELQHSPLWEWVKTRLAARNQLDLTAMFNCNPLENPVKYGELRGQVVARRDLLNETFWDGEIKALKLVGGKDA